MAIRFLYSGGQFEKQTPGTTAGFWNPWFTGTTQILSNAPAGRASTYGINSGGNNIGYAAPFPGQYGSMYAGMASYQTAFTAANTLIGFRLGGVNQCELRTDSVGHLYFTRNAVNLGAGNPTTSTNVMTPNSWHYIEFKAIFSTGGTGTCEVRVDSVVWLTLTSLTNATTTAKADQAGFAVTGGGYIRDIYAVDGDGGVNTTYQGDISVLELYSTGAGTNSAWTTNSGAVAAATGPFTLTSVNTSGVYQGTITGGASNAYIGYKFDVTGFTNGANNQTGAICTASTATALTLGGSTVTETHAGSAAFECPVQIGIAGTGTVPSLDSLYVMSNTPNALSDFTHQALAFTGNIPAIMHVSYARKDDAGARTMSQISVNGGTTVEVGPVISLSNTYTYYGDILEFGPTTGPLVVASVNTVGVYTGTFPSGGSNAYAGFIFNITGFINAVNNQTGVTCTASSTTTITLGGTTISESASATATGGLAWTLSSVNGTSFGVKELT